MIFTRLNNQHLVYLQKRGKLFYEERTRKFKQNSGTDDREAVSMALLFQRRAIKQFD